MKTATIERTPMYGTGRPILRVLYRGKIIHWSQGSGVQVYALAQDDGDDVREAMRQRAKGQGFTHVRYAGEWGSRKPKGGAL